MACKKKQDIGYCTQEMLRWYDKMGGVSPMVEASRNRQKNLTPIGKTRKINIGWNKLNLPLRLPSGA